MNWFFLLALIFVAVSVAMILIILVQRPQGGGLAGAFGGAGGGGADTVFGGRVGDALTWATVIAFIVFLTLAVTLNLLPIPGTVPVDQETETISTTDDGLTDSSGDAGLDDGTSGGTGAGDSNDSGEPTTDPSDP